MKYTDIKVLKIGYVSSSHDYFVEVSYQEHGWLYSEDYCLSRGQFETAERKPQYMLVEVKRQIALLVKQDAIVWYEYDRDGNKRYSNLRYYDRELLLEIVKDW